MTENELREALRAHGFNSLNEFLDLRDEVNKTSGEIKYKLLREEHENKEKSEEEETEKEIYCTECSHFEDVVEDGRSWYGALCNKDGHESAPSMYAIQSLHENCPLKKKEELNGLKIQ